MPSVTITITTNDECTLLKIQRVLAWMHYNSRWGHSGTVATDLDGDGPDRVTVEGFDVGPHRPFVANARASQRRVEWMGCEQEPSE